MSQLRNKSGGAVTLRRWLWSAGAAASLCYYFASSIPRAHRTPSGVERRLFGLADLDPELHGSPSGRRWMLVRKRVEEYGPPPGALPTMWDKLQSIQWPPDQRAPRILFLSAGAGTWE